MNYIILNGKKSTNINGLLIQSLPPITKARMRTQIDEIDGRDGDIITPLGFSSYDRQVSIGLFGNFNIDEIIEYFNSSGQVIFSNEPYKYYNYTIINQIDFERLVRYKTAIVTFHVQPFKYSAVEEERTFEIDGNLLSIPDTTLQSNGLTLTASDGEISIFGTASAVTEFYLPIQALNLQNGSFSLNAYASGTGVGSTSIRMIEHVPSNVQSFGGGYVTLENEDTVTLSDTFTSNVAFNYLWFYIQGNVEIDYSLNIEVSNIGDKSISIVNAGNIYAKPVLTLYGTGTINLSLNGEQIFAIDLGNDASITIDVANMEAYNGNTLKNRNVTGNYDNFVLQIGENTISWAGDVTEIDINRYSRWI